jgi:hypothetical protein
MKTWFLRGLLFFFILSTGLSLYGGLTIFANTSKEIQAILFDLNLLNDCTSLTPGPGVRTLEYTPCFPKFGLFYAFIIFIFSIVLPLKLIKKKD